MEAEDLKRSLNAPAAKTAPPLRGSDSANTTAGCVKEAANKEKKHKVQEKIQNSPGLAHKRHVRSAGENGSQMLLPKPKKEMFTAWCTLYTKLVPAVGPRLFFSGMTSKQRIPRWWKAPPNAI